MADDMTALLAENPTGALGLYSGLGFEVTHTHTSHVLEY